MSAPQNPRPRIVFNGGRGNPTTRTIYYYWCRICRRIIRLGVGNPLQISITCPFCFRNLRHELDVATARFHHDPFTSDLQFSSDPSWITLQFSNSAADSGVDAIPRVEITELHLEKDPNCAICKEEFEIGGEVRELPCKHFYHSDCVLPWLRIHNTCPVCRYTLPDVAAAAIVDDGGGGEELVEGGDGRGNGWWNLVSSWWPFCLIGDWVRRRLRFVNSGDSFFVVERKIFNFVFNVSIAKILHAILIFVVLGLTYVVELT